MALILMYHNVVESEAERETFHPAHRPYVLTRDEFAAHIDTALGMGWRFLCVDDIYSDAWREKKALLLTFDDSWENHTATDVLEERGIRGVFFLNSGELGWEGRMSSDEAAGMSARGHEIGSHSVKHEFLSRLDDATLRQRLGESKQVLEEVCGKEVRFLSAPGGRYNTRVADVAREVGYKAFFVSWPGWLGDVEREFLVKRFSVAANIDADRLAVILERTWPLMLKRKLKYKVRLVMELFNRKHGGEGH